MTERPPTKRTWLQRLGHAVTRAAETVAPGWALRRQALGQLREIRARQHARVMERYFEGADTTGRLRGDMWLKSRLSIDDALEQDLPDLRDHSNELYRDFGYVTGAIDHRTDNVVGCGLRPRAAIKPVQNAATGVTISEAEAEQWNQQLDDLFERWAQKCGRGGKRTFGDVQRLAHKIWRREGDSFVVLSDVGRADKPVPLQLDVIGPKRVETPPEKASDENCRMGVQKNATGTAAGDVLGYWIRETDPDETTLVNERYRFYPADRVCHLMDDLWGDQTRGLPWTFPIQSDARDFKDFKEAVILNAQAAACVMMVIGTNNPDLLARGNLNSSGEQEMSPGRILYTQDGDKVTGFAPTQPGTTYGMFSEWTLLGISAGLNYPFGWVVKDRRRATFSAGRLEEIDGGVPLRCDHQVLKDRLIVPTWERFVQEAVIVGAVSIDPSRFNRAPHLFTRCTVQPQGRPWVDPTKEVTAAVMAKEHNLDTVAGILGRHGLDMEETFRQRSREKAMEAELEIAPPITGGTPAAGDEPAADPADDNEEPAETEAAEAAA